MQQEKRSRRIRKYFLGKRGFKVVGLSIGLVSVVFISSVLAINNYLQSNQTKLIDNLPFLNEGSLSFDRMRFGIFRNFPSATLSFENLVVRDSLFDQHQIPVLQVERLDLNLSLAQFLSNEVEIKSMDLISGRLRLFTDENGYNNIQSFVRKTKNQGRTNAVKTTLDSEGIQVGLREMDIRHQDMPKKMDLWGKLQAAEIFLKKEDENFLFELDIQDLLLNELTFNRDKGSFLVNSSLKGKINGNLGPEQVSLVPAALKINKENFLLSGTIFPKKDRPSTLILENTATSYGGILPLLTKQLQQNITPYQIEGKFYSKTRIQSYFRHGENPRVDIDLRMVDNDLKVQEYEFLGARLDARIVNRFFDDKRAENEERGKIRLEVHDFAALHDAFDIQGQNGQILASRQQAATISMKTDIKGRASGISKWLNNDKFVFSKGKFTLNADVKGPLTSFKEIIIESDANLELQDLAVEYKPAQTAFPVQEITLRKKAGDADFSLVSTTFESGHFYRLRGGLFNLAALLVELSDKQTSSKVLWIANKIGWRDFVDLFGEDGSLKPKTDLQKKRSMKETISGIRRTFHPELSVFVDTVTYFDRLELYNFSTGIRFEEDTLVLDETRFRVGDGSVVLSGRMDISKPNFTPFEFELHTEKLNLREILPSLDYFNIKLLKNLENLPENVSISVKHKGTLDDAQGFVPNTSTGEIVFRNASEHSLSGTIRYRPSLAPNDEVEMKNSFVNTEIELEGDPFIFNEFFKNEEFFFDKGNFRVKFEYEGDVASIEQLLNKGKATFTMENSEVYYSSVELSFPLTQVDIDVKGDTANFDLLMYSDSIDQELHFKGDIDNMSELILGNTGKIFTINTDIHSPRIQWGNFLQFFAPQMDTTKTAEQTSLSLKATVRSLLNTLDPRVNLEVDTFQYAKLIVHHVESGVHLVDTNTIALDKTGFQFHDGSMSLNGQIDMASKTGTPFSIHVNTQDLDIARLFESLDYLSIAALQETEKLEGRMTLDLSLVSKINEEGTALLPAYTRGIIDFDLNNVELEGLSVIDSLAIKLKRRKRFKTLRFAPISNQLIIKGKEIEIPLMEVQSNALNMFVEGVVSLDDKTNVWLSIPWNNLRKPDAALIPNKKGYAASANKLYVEIKSDTAKNAVFKVHLNKKKYYQERQIMDNYKSDKERWRKRRKKTRRDKKYKGMPRKE